MVEEVRLSWNTLYPYMLELAEAAQKRLETEEKGRKSQLATFSLATTK